MDLKDSLIDVDRAYALIKTINDVEHSNSDNISDIPLNDAEKWKIVCDYMKQNPELFMKILPTSKKKSFNINLQNTRLKSTKLDSKDKFPMFPNTVKQAKHTPKFKTMEKDKANKFENSLNLNNKIKNNKYLSRDSNSPAVPLPARSRLCNNSTKETNCEANCNKDLKAYTKGTSFELKPLHHRFSKEISKPCNNFRKTNYNEFLNSKFSHKSRAVTGELQKRSKQKDVQSEAPKLFTQQQFEMKMHEKSKISTDISKQHRVKSMIDNKEECKLNK